MERFVKSIRKKDNAFDWLVLAAGVILLAGAVLAVVAAEAQSLDNVIPTQTVLSDVKTGY